MDVTRRKRWSVSTTALVALVLTGTGLAGCSEAEVATATASRPVYRAVMPGFCEELPFGVFEEQLGLPRHPFGTYDVSYGSLESIGIVDTMYGSCDVSTSSTQPERMIWDTVFVLVDTYTTAQQARRAFARRRLDHDMKVIPFPSLDNRVDGWRAFEHASMYAHHGERSRTIEMVRSNVVASVVLDFIPERVSEARFAAATVTFIDSLWTSLPRNTATVPPHATSVAAREPYHRLPHGFSPSLNLDALMRRLGPVRKDPYPDFRSEDSTMVGFTLRTEGRTEGTTKLRGGIIELHIKYLDGAQQARDFFARHFTAKAPSFPPFGPMADVTGLSWQYQAPSGRHDGRYLVAVVDNNAVILLNVGSYTGNEVAVIDTALAGPVAETLNATLMLVRLA